VYENLTGIKVVAITDSNPIKVAEASREFQLPGFSTVEEMLESTELDIACIVTPPAEHEEPVFRCAASGVH
jgi:predicted dehydrogenase